MSKQTQKYNWHLETRTIELLKGHEHNPNVMNARERKDLAAGIDKFGLIDKPVINLDNSIIGGHHRIADAKDRNEKTIECWVPDKLISEKDRDELLLRLNQNRGNFDPEKLKWFGLDMLLNVGFKPDELSTMFFDILTITDDQIDLEKAIEEVGEPVTRRGDIILLGDHKLLCGDSMNREEVAVLFPEGTALANMIFCDPPYNIRINYSSGVSDKKKRYSNKDSYKDDIADTDYSKLLHDTIQNALEFSNEHVHCFYWCDENYIFLVQQLFQNLKIHLQRVCFWVKNAINPVPQVAFNKVIEPCVYGTRGKPWLNKDMRNLHEIINREYQGGNPMDDVLAQIQTWLVKKDFTNNYLHPTQKPVSLMEKPIKRCTAPGEIVLDLFGGSGSTLMACEQLKRMARLVEQDPVFCDVIVNRWEKLTGKKAERFIKKETVTV